MSYDTRQSDLSTGKADKAKAAVKVAMLAKVLQYDADKLTVDVQPINKERIDGDYASAPPMMSIPVACLCGKGYIVRPWFDRGDVGVVVICDGDNDAALEGNGDEVEPSTARNHAPEDGVFIGGLCPAGQLPAGLPDNALVLAAGETWIAVSAGGVEITGDVAISGSLTANSIDLTAHTHAVSGGSTGQPR